MKKIYRIIKILVQIFLNSPFKTVYINFKMLSFRDAIFFPILICSKTKFRSLKGRIIIEGDIKPCMIRIGDSSRYPVTSTPCTVLTINGEIVFTGKINFYNGTYVYVAEKAKLKLGTNGTFVGSDVKIICREYIGIGDNVEVSWGTQIYDTSFHYVSYNGCECFKLTSPITIGNNVWIGNNVTISKGSRLPSNTIVASNSLINRDFSDLGENTLLAGVPAVCKISNARRIYGVEEKELDKKYLYIRYKL